MIKRKDKRILVNVDCDFNIKLDGEVRSQENSTLTRGMSSQASATLEHTLHQQQRGKQRCPAHIVFGLHGNRAAVLMKGRRDNLDHLGESIQWRGTLFGEENIDLGQIGNGAREDPRVVFARAQSHYQTRALLAQYRHETHRVRVLTGSGNVWAAIGGHRTRKDHQPIGHNHECVPVCGQRMKVKRVSVKCRERKIVHSQ